MSNIYIQEPPTNGKVLLQTTVGDIDIELWSKEAPKACTNFIQLCMEGYYNGTIFHRIIKGFIVQGGDPTGTGIGGESIYGHPFKDEFHSRLRFVRRGLVASANAGKDDNGSQFFFTLGSCQELQNKHTIFGKVTGNTLYNMLKLEESLVDQNDRPLYPHKIITAKVVLNPFPDIVPRVLARTDDETLKEKKNQSKATKNFSLLSFGEEAEEEEAGDDAVAREFRGKSKSSHDLANDPKLSSVPAVNLEGNNSAIEKEETVIVETKDTFLQESTAVENVRKKLKKDIPEKTETGEKLLPPSQLPLPPPPPPPIEIDEDELEKQKKENEREEIRQEIKKLQKELKEQKKKTTPEEKDTDIAEDSDKEEEEDPKTSFLFEFHQEIEKYAEKKKQISKGADREEQTLALLTKFQSKMKEAKENIKEDKENDSEGSDDEGWLTHILHFEDEGPVIAKDASLNTADRYEISDPRNPITQRRRQASKQALKQQ